MTLTAPDAAAARDFYAAVLQVPFAPAHRDVFRAEETRPPFGIFPAAGGAPQVQLSYRVDDLAAALERVRAAGGQAGEPERRAFGLSAECTDNQGVTFRLWQPPENG